MDRREESRALAVSARQCAAVRNGLALADWVSAGRSVTAKHVLRRADVPLAGQMLGVEVPQWVRSAADVPALHCPWTAALGVGLLSISGGRAVAGQVRTGWDRAADDEILDGWSRGLAAVLADTFADDGDGTESLEIGRLVLSVLTTDPPSGGSDLLRAITYAVIGSNRRLHKIFLHGCGMRDPAEVALEVLEAFGAAHNEGEQWRITPLGHWALSRVGGSDSSPPGRSGTEIGAEVVCQLKISLRYARPACWRRVLVPASATLGDLHEIIQIAFSWDDEHLHAFTIGRRRYGDPYFDAEYDEDEITVATALARARKSISYVYDFGDNWQHEITLEKTVEPDPASTYPVCVDGRGDSPVEDCGEDEPAWIRFDQADINTRLARLDDEVRQIDARLRDDIEIILTDAYGEAEELTAFWTVLEAEIDLPVPATLLGQPVIVTGLIEDDDAFELRARCWGKTANGSVCFADLEFLSGTVEAWLHAAYLSYLGRAHPALTPPSGWDGLDHWRS
ncbi:plasmid pRiA4b ORF-3 family protein [Nocardia sp. CA-135953]|uniref:plasmid pRiA4b ORF-3 family protein n=1 Tax=Nocardia sp. CA-135953 TaxID=3239978 RepID=UPI003D990349